MEKDRIIEILDGWNFWSRDLDCGVLRTNFLSEIDRLSKTGQVVVITGVRRSGKSTLIKQYIKRLVDAGMDRKNFLYVNLEEARFAGELSLDFLQQVYDAYLEIVGPSSKPFIFLDEVQKIGGWEKFIRSLHEKNEAKLFVSGSSAKLLSKEFGSTLTGRHVDVTVYPLSFVEFLSFNNVKIKTKLDVLSNKLKLAQLLRRYIAEGGFPLVAISSEKSDLLARYFDDVITRDVAERYNVRKIEKLRSLARYYFTNISSLCSFRKVAGFTGMSLNTVERFSHYFQSGFLLFFVNKFSRSFKEQEVSPRKVYAIDLGLRNIIAFKITEDMGKLFENAVFLHLLTRGKEVYYYGGKRECDFVVKEKDKITKVIQVCYEVTSENKTREVEGLLEAMGAFKLRDGTIVTGGLEATEKHEGKTVKFVPLWKWLPEDEVELKQLR